MIPIDNIDNQNYNNNMVFFKKTNNNYRDSKGWTLVHYCCWFNAYACLAALCKMKSVKAILDDKVSDCFFFFFPSIFINILFFYE